MFWDAYICPYCGTECPIGIMSLIARCDCGAWYEDTCDRSRRGWHKELDEVLG